MPIHHSFATSHDNACLQTLRGQPIPWIWDGLVAEEAVTLVSAPEKTGKTTLVCCEDGIPDYDLRERNIP